VLDIVVLLGNEGEAIASKTPIPKLEISVIKEG
jgi:hypothetical protein